MVNIVAAVLPEQANVYIAFRVYALERRRWREARNVVSHGDQLAVRERKTVAATTVVRKTSSFRIVGPRRQTNLAALGHGGGSDHFEKRRAI